MRRYGLVGKKLGHSFSKTYFEAKFASLGIKDASYSLFELEDAEAIPSLFSAYPDLKGLNVTIPFKESVMPFLDSLDLSARKVGAVNVIKRDESGLLEGYNTDYQGFMSSFLRFVPMDDLFKVLLIGTGGVAKACAAVFRELEIEYAFVSRSPKLSHEEAPCYGFQEITESLLLKHKVLVNCTPVGMYPHAEQLLPIPYAYLNKLHYCMDLIYNPEKTLFLREAEKKGAQTKNGLEMLYAQADEAWRIWQQD